MSSELAVQSCKLGPKRRPASAATERVAAHALHERLILDHLGASQPVTQRKLAAELGIALGLTNLLMRRLVKKGWVRATRLTPRRIRYLVTPAGVAAKARLTREYFLYCLQFYGESRARVRERLAQLTHDLSGETDARIVFFGLGDVAEVAYVCLQETDLELIGVVDSARRGTFFQHSIAAPEALLRCELSGRRFSRLLVMPLQDENQVRAHIARQQVPSEAVFWL